MEADEDEELPSLHDVARRTTPEATVAKLEPDSGKSRKRKRCDNESDSDIEFVGATNPSIAKYPVSSNGIIDLSGDTPPQSPTMQTGRAMLNDDSAQRLEKWYARASGSQARPRPSATARAERAAGLAQTQTSTSMSPVKPTFPLPTPPPSQTPPLPPALVPDSQPEACHAYPDHGEGVSAKRRPNGELRDTDDPFMLQDLFVQDEPSLLPQAHRSSGLAVPEILIESAELEGPETLGTTAVPDQIDLERSLLAVHPLDNVLHTQADDRHLHAAAARRRKDKGKERESHRQSKSPVAEVTHVMLSKASKSKNRPVHFRHRNAIVWTGREVEGELSPDVTQLMNSEAERAKILLPEQIRTLLVLFESNINEQIAIEEPFAPRVKLVVDRPKSVADVPPWEFVYTNRLLYRKSVSIPIQAPGCRCVGPCDPNNEDCWCVKRQTDWGKQWNEPPGFAYDHAGRVTTDSEVPIWECNSECSCSAECMNRKVSNGRTIALDIVKTRKKGWGPESLLLPPETLLITIGAGIMNGSGQSIPRGSFLCIYSGEVLTWKVADIRGRQNEEMPNPRSYLFDIDSRFMSYFKDIKDFEEEGLMVIADNRPASKIRGTDLPSAQAMKPEEEIRNTKSTYTVDAMYYGNISRYFNHSCSPNAEIRSVFVDDMDTAKPILAIFAKRKIRAGAEVCISYRGYVEGAISDDSDSDDDTPRPRRRGKPSRKQGGTLAQHNDGVVDSRCYCEAPNCDGRMFNKADEDE